MRRKTIPDRRCILPWSPGSSAQALEDLTAEEIDLSYAVNTHATLLLARDKFPDWVLLQGADELEVDLRRVPGEEDSKPSFWMTAQAYLEDRLARLRTHVRKELVDHVSVFALARIPILVLLGTMLDDTIKTELYPKRRDAAEGWGWDESATTWHGYCRRSDGNYEWIITMIGRPRVCSSG